MLIANSIWGLTTPMAKVVLLFGSITFLSLTSFRLFGAAILFWVASLFTKKEKVNFHDLTLLFLASLFCIVFSQGSFMMGLSMTSPIDASIMTTTTPIFTLIISAIYLKEEITWIKIAGIFLGAAGAILLILSGKESISSGSVLGNCLCMFAQLSFSIYLVMFKGLIDRFTPGHSDEMDFHFRFSLFYPFFFSLCGISNLQHFNPPDLLLHCRNCTGRNVSFLSPGFCRTACIKTIRSWYV